MMHAFTCKIFFVGNVLKQRNKVYSKLIKATHSRSISVSMCKNRGSEENGYSCSSCFLDMNLLKFLFEILE